MILVDGVWFGADLHCVLSEVGSLDVMVYGAMPEEVLAGDLSTTQVADDWEAQVNGCCGIRWVLLVVWAFRIWCRLMSSNYILDGLMTGQVFFLGFVLVVSIWNWWRRSKGPGTGFSFSSHLSPFL